MLSHSLRNLWLIFKHEYIQRVRTRSFLAATLLLPLFTGLVVAIPALLTTGDSRQRSQHLVLVCPNPDLAELVRGQVAAVTRGRYLIEIDPDASDGERDRLAAALGSRRIDGYLWMDPDAVSSGRVIYARRGSGDFVGQVLLRDALSTALTRERLRRRGIAPQEADAMLKRAVLQPVTLEAGRERRDTAVSGIIIVFLFVSVLFITLLSYGVMVMRSVLDEKASRVMEVLLCAATAEELMGGKILGVGAVGLTQVIIWGVLGVAVAAPHAAAAGGFHVPLSFAAYFALFYVLGYLLYSAMFAAVGAAFNSTDEAQQWNFVIISPLIIASALMTLVAGAPNSRLAVVSSMIPFWAPVLMYLRIVVQPPPLWQILLCIAILFATICVALAVCARVYRVGILMYGKRPTAREVIKWLRYA